MFVCERSRSHSDYHCCVLSLMSQEVPVADLVRPIVKKVYEITDVNDVASTVLEALYVCTSGRPGPVLIDFPKNIQQQRVST